MTLKRNPDIPVNEAWAHTPEMEKRFESVKQYIDQTPVWVISPEKLKNLREIAARQTAKTSG